MPDLHEWAREGRLLSLLAIGTRNPGISDMEGVLAVDFLLQHPSALRDFATLSEHRWAPRTMPTDEEAESSEEALLKWKRSVAGEVVIPILRRLIGRGLVEREGPTLVVSTSGTQCADRLATTSVPEQRDRVRLLTLEFRADPEGAARRLLSALSAEGPDG